MTTTAYYHQQQRQRPASAILCTEAKPVPLRQPYKYLVITAAYPQTGVMCTCLITQQFCGQCGGLVNQLLEWDPQVTRRPPSEQWSRIVLARRFL